MLRLLLTRGGWLALLLCTTVAAAQTPATIPLPEHPRPDFERPQWINLNGAWDFRFDSLDVGEKERWYDGEVAFPQTITVPFSWAAPLAGVEGDADIGWYARTITIPEAWAGKEVYLVIGASDSQTKIWLDGRKQGWPHEWGYIPFAFKMPLTPGEHRLVIRVDDTPRPYQLEGKQGYGQARGIWQTPYLEVRGGVPLKALHFSPDIDAEKVTVTAYFDDYPPRDDLTLHLRFKNADLSAISRVISQDADHASFDVAIPKPHLWSLDDPFLYEVEARLGAEGVAEDTVHTYFGMRKISVEMLPGTDYPYVALNGEPIYLQMSLDQAYHPEGFYTFPSDAFMRDEILRARQIGLNGQRIHVKVGIPRKLYWADRLGMLIMADVPNSWGEPTSMMQDQVHYTLINMIRRDYNHPSIFAWVPFNETWGLFTTRTGADGKERREYLPETQDWVAWIYRMAKHWDPTRLVEDNSPCCGTGHTETDLNSWHAYLPGWAWEEHLGMISDSTFDGSTWNFEEGYRQGQQPNINSEFGNVWGYEGSTGDVDWSWDYHRAVNAFRRHPKIAGWLYTEHHDVVNEWNGYWRYDRSEKETGLSELVEGMTLRDLHAPLYISTGGDLSRAVQAGETVQVPLFASFMTGSQAHGDTLTLHATLYGWDALGRQQSYFSTERAVPYRPWMNAPLDPLAVPMPDTPAMAVLALRLEASGGAVLQRNFTTFVVQGAAPDTVTLTDGRTARLVRVDPAAFDEASWSLKQWAVLDGLKVNGAGSGYFEYHLPWPDDVRLDDVETATLVLEASAKQLFGKDRDADETIEGDFMRGRGTLDPSLNPNAYPMTDETRFPSAMTVRVQGLVADRIDLPDDPADHRGILSWHAQLQDRRLREAGSYGYLVRVNIPRPALERAAASGTIVIRLEVDAALPGGLALYGKHFGRYPLDPTLMLIGRSNPAQDEE